MRNNIVNNIKYTKALGEKIAEYLRNNKNKAQCARDFGLCYSTLCVWVKKYEPLQAAVKKGAGRPTKYTSSINSDIFELRCKGWGLKKIATALKISLAVIYRWKRVHPDFKEMLQTAKEIAADNMVEEMVALADDSRKDLIADKKTGREFPNAANVARSRLKIKTRERVAGFYNPEKYGSSVPANKSNINVSCDTITFMGLSITPPKEAAAGTGGKEEVIIKELGDDDDDNDDGEESFEELDEPDNNQ
mmetsp:Transcript_22779/g.10968  ORF Transcript_22779/g.10968 Transcript_22779/m.10968 type:complete len:248 (+) Transcript_22779:3521-4264(+)